MSAQREHDSCFVIGTMMLSAKVKYGVGSSKCAMMSWTVLCASVSAVFACAIHPTSLSDTSTMTRSKPNCESGRSWMLVDDEARSGGRILSCAALVIIVRVLFGWIQQVVASLWSRSSTVSDS